MCIDKDPMIILDPNRDPQELLPKLYLANAFSLSMIAKFISEFYYTLLYIEELTLEKVKGIIARHKEMGTLVSAIGHESTAKVLSELLETEIPANRIAVSLNKGDGLIVFQLLERLPPGKELTIDELKKLIKEGKAKFYLVEIKE